PVDLSPAACAANEPRRFVAPQPPPDRPLELAFRFYPQDASLFESLPATLTLQVRPTNLLPPRIVLESPAAVAPGGSDTLDATGSSDPHGGLVRFRWRQVSGPTAFLGPCGNEDATEGCRVLTLPEDATGLLVLELEVLSEATGLVTRRRVEIPVVGGAPWGAATFCPSSRQSSRAQPVPTGQSTRSCTTASSSASSRRSPASGPTSRTRRSGKRTMPLPGCTSASSPPTAAARRSSTPSERMPAPAPPGSARANRSPRSCPRTGSWD